MQSPPNNPQPSNHPYLLRCCKWARLVYLDLILFTRDSRIRSAKIYLVCRRDYIHFSFYVFTTIKCITATDIDVWKENRSIPSRDQTTRISSHKLSFPLHIKENLLSISRMKSDVPAILCFIWDWDVSTYSICYLRWERYLLRNYSPSIQPIVDRNCQLIMTYQFKAVAMNWWMNVIKDENR